MNNKWKTIKEGETDFLLFVDSPNIYDSSVFYNQKMTINRDICLLHLFALGENHKQNMRMLDPLAGCGVRAYRILNELPREFVKEIHLCDINPLAIQNIEKNIELLDIQRNVVVRNTEALEFITSYLPDRKGIDVIDLDPFGSPIEFLEMSIRLLKGREGYLFVTATDHQVLCGKYQKSCLRIYGSMTTNAYMCHEIAVRILLYTVLKSAGRHGMAINPLISLSYQHFFRLHIKLLKNKQLANKQQDLIGFVLFCKYCSYYISYKLKEYTHTTICPQCQRDLEKVGPLWLGRLHDQKTIKEMLSIIDKLNLPSHKQLIKILKTIQEEVNGPFLFYHLPYLFKMFKMNSVRTQTVIDAIKEKNHIVTRTHFDPMAIKTNIPYYELLKTIETLEK